MLQFNPLWLSSPKHDLQTDKEFHFNHTELVSQFAVKIPCYKASTMQRLQIVARRELPFANWVSHLRAVHYGGKDLQTWTLEHPYDCPVTPVTRRPAPARRRPRALRRHLGREGRQEAEPVLGHAG